MPPNQYCKSTREDFYIKAASGNLKCNIHQPIWVDKKTGYQLCRACAHLGQPDTVVIERWPVRLSEWLLAQGRIDILPAHNPHCTGIFANSPPQIISPEKGSLYEVRSGIPLEYQQILFKATAGQESSKVHWFLDSRLFASCEVSRKIFYKPEKGLHRLMCVDDLGRSSTITFEVQ
jgi:penicillin-binding protein 1C